MFWRGVLSCVVAILLSGCASDRTGFDYAGLMQRVGPPKPGQSRIVVLQEKRSGLSMAFCACEVKVDESPLGKLKSGTYVYADAPAGRHQLTADETLFPGQSKREVMTEPGRTYFFLTKTTQRHDAVTGGALVGGLAGAALTAVVTSGSDNAGPVDFLPLDEASARTTIAELQLAD
jgi:Protein of unknown function (DUF2846)